MSVCAVMLVKDEIDIVGYTIDHLAEEVDEVVVADNRSTDGTAEMLRELAKDGRIRLEYDPDPGYWQAQKTTRLALEALDRGHQWVVPCDADEWWYATDGRPIRDYLAGLAPDVSLVEAPLYNHLPTALDPPTYLHGFTATSDPGTPNPFQRIGWRQRECGALPKVAVRLRPQLEIRQGNHSAWAPGSGLAVRGGLVVRHFSWRSAEQYLRKIRNGERAYGATNLGADVGAHWRMFEGKPDEAVVEHFETWFWMSDPANRDDLIFDPAPGA